MNPCTETHGPTTDSDLFCPRPNILLKYNYSHALILNKRLWRSNVLLYFLFLGGGCYTRRGILIPKTMEILPLNLHLCFIMSSFWAGMSMFIWYCTF